MTPRLPKIYHVALALLQGTAALGGELPDPALTPGALNPEVSQETISTTICLRG